MRDIVDPAGVRWNVRRRWYPWRRTMSFRETWSSSPSEPGADDTGTAADTEGDAGLPRSVVLKAILLVLAGLVWVVLGIGKVLMYSVAALLFITISLAELALELVVMPVVLLLRLFGAARWPVQINRQGKHFATHYADDFAAANLLCDEVAGQIEVGSPPQSSAA